MSEHRSKNTLGRSVPLKTMTDKEDDGRISEACLYFFENRSITIIIIFVNYNYNYNYFNTFTNHLVIYIDGKIQNSIFKITPLDSL